MSPLAINYIYKHLIFVAKLILSFTIIIAKHLWERAWWDEEHDKARICCQLKKVRALFLPKTSSNIGACLFCETFKCFSFGNSLANLWNEKCENVYEANTHCSIIFATFELMFQLF